MQALTRTLILVTVVVLLIAPVGGVVGTTGTVGFAAGEGVTDVAASDSIAATQEDLVTLTIAIETPAGDPVGGADITASWENGSNAATTASNGRALVDVPAGATVEIAIDHPEYMRNEVYTVEDAEEESVTITVRDRGSLTLQVEDTAGNPVADAQVILRESGDIVVNGRTNSDGSLATGAIEQRDYGLSVVKQGYYRSSSEVTVEKSTRESVTIEQGSVTVSFVVTDDRFDPPEPVSDAQISLESVGTFRTLQNGEATAQVPVNADLDLEVTKEGYKSKTRSLEVNESPRTVELTISRTPMLNVTSANDRTLVGERNVITVVDAYGDPVADATVRVDGDAVGTTGSDGTVTIQFDEAGDHVIVAETDERTSEELTIRAVQERTATPTDAQTPTETATRTAEPTTEPTTEVNFPGFTPLTVLLAVIAFTALFARRRVRSGE